MKSVEPWGNLGAASILVIGHDPRLQKYGAEAKHAFFFEYLEGPQPTYGPALAKYKLAKAIVDYVDWLANRKIAKDQLFVTNLCNAFLEHVPGSGTVLIPNQRARIGIAEIQKAVANGRFKVILPMSVQVFYHLSRTHFLDEDTDLVRQFVISALPREEKAKQGIYASAKPAPFLQMVGKQFHHHGIPVIPIVHIKQWRNGVVRVEKYRGPMDDAGKLVQDAIEVS